MPSNYCPYPYESFTTEEYKEFFVSFVTEHHSEDVAAIIGAEDAGAHYGIEVGFLALVEADQRIGSILLAHPRELFPLFEDAVIAVENRMVEEANCGTRQQNGDVDEGAQQLQATVTVKQHVHVRLDSLHGCCPEVVRTSGLPMTCDIGKFLEVQGTAIRVGNTRVLENTRTYACVKCERQFTLVADVETGFQFELPATCPGIAAGTGKPCQGKGFTIVEGLNDFMDIQEIKIQEHAHKIGVGSIPRQISVLLCHDLVDRCQAGDTVVVIGEVRTRWKKEREGERCELEVAMVANNVRTDNDDRRSSGITDEMRNEFQQYWERFKESPLRGRDELLACICPTIYGLYIVKLAVALVLIGGVARNDPSGMRIRGQCHLLLVGEPGTGKSQFLKFASKLGPRHVLATGGGTSSAGLTVAAIREPGGEWALEAGALVLADGGVCCIDEFSSVKVNDRATIHEAMEQQTISVAKAGIVCRLHTRTAILAATNAKGKYDRNQSLSVNVALDSPLLSRFDMVLLLLDTQNAEWDDKVASFILSGRQENSSAPIPWPIEKLQSYISYVKTSIQPRMGHDAQMILTEYYQRQRKSDLAESARSTIRLLESLIRVSEAHARLMMRDEVSSQDAVVAVTIVEASMATSALGGEVPSALHSDFPEDPEVEYSEKEKEVLNALGLADEVHPFSVESAVLHKTKKDAGNEGTTAPVAATATTQTTLPIKSPTADHKRKQPDYDELDIGDDDGDAPKRRQ